ncbi:flagellar biosynthetic protein FliR [Treponema sp.]|uniref:flagellar biosynthetic protein FliR n=1 Tax=Treponema sp. TaxID=166 RepID=UPI003F082AAC
MFEKIVSGAPVFLFVAVRCFATIMTLPLFSSRTIPRMAKVALAGYMAFFIFPQISVSEGIFSSYGKYISPDGNFTLEYVLLLLGEGLIGVILGFFVQIIFASFSTAGQFFAFQMGLSASEVYDSLSQVENPLMGQFFNFMAMLVFLHNNWFHKLLLEGMNESFKVINALSIVDNSLFLAEFMMKSLSLLFKDALIIALPIMASLFLVNVTVGILAKAAPQMNLLSEAFPILILTAYYLIFVLIPQFNEFFASCFSNGIKDLEVLFKGLKGGGL